MFLRLSRRYSWEAAHFLPNFPDGHKCKTMHGHSYELEVTVEVDHNFRMGHAMDFAVIDEQVHREVVSVLDHKTINDITGLGNGTLETVAIWILGKLIRHLPTISQVDVWEGPRSHVQIPVDRSHVNYIASFEASIVEDRAARNA